MLSKTFGQITKQGQPQKVAKAAKSLLIEASKKQNPEISSLIDRLSDIDSSQNRESKESKYEKLNEDLNSRADSSVRHKFLETVGKAEYLYKSVELSQEMQILQKKMDGIIEGTQEPEIIDEQTIIKNIRQFSGIPIRPSLIVQAKDIANVITDDSVDSKTLDKMISSYASTSPQEEKELSEFRFTGGSSLRDDFPLPNDSGKFLETAQSLNEYDIFEMNEDERQVVPKPFEVKKYVQTQLLDSLNATDGSKSSEIIRKSIRDTIDNKAETIAEYRQILSQTTDNLVYSIVDDMHKKPEGQVLLPLQKVTEAGTNLDKATEYYKSQAEGAKYDLAGTCQRLYGFTDTTFDNVETSISQNKNRIAIEKLREEYEAGKAIDSATIDKDTKAKGFLNTSIKSFYDKVSKGDIPTSPDVWDTMEFVDMVSAIPEQALPKDRKISFEEEQKKLPKALDELLQRNRSR